MTIAEAVKRYLEIAGEFGRAAPLESFGLSKAETEKAFSAWDEDYQINRYLLLTGEVREISGQGKPFEAFSINGYECTHITFQPHIQELL